MRDTIFESPDPGREPELIGRDVVLPEPLELVVPFMGSPDDLFKIAR
jgi:hypothetical protein